METNKTLLLLAIFCIHSQLIAKTDKYRCIWRDDPATTMTIGWNQVTGTNPTVYYGTSDYGTDVSSYPTSQKPNRRIWAKGMNNHFARLTNLLPATKYYFVIKDSEGVSKRFWFRTAPDNPYERLSIVAGGDSRNHRKGRQNANRIVSKLRPHFVLFAGDMTGSDNTTQWRAWFDDWQLTITKDGKITPIVPARGNHEYANKTITDMFDVANPNIYYAQSVGGNLMRIYTLNSMIASGGDQKAWLVNDLNQNGEQATWRMAQYHHPIRPHTAKKVERQAGYKHWGKLFYEKDVELVLECDAHVVKTTWPVRPTYESGHDEGFKRDKGGTVYVGEGCWGAPLRPANDGKRWTRSTGSFNQVKWIFVDREKIEIRTIKTDNALSVAALSEHEQFRIPKGLNIWKPSNGSVVTIDKATHLAARKGRVTSVASSTTKNTTSSKTTRTTNSQKELVVANFKTIKELDKVQLKWVTLSEPNDVLCEIQRSTTGFDYKTISSLRFGGGDKQERKYMIKDENISRLNVPFLYYRLKYTFPDNSEKISGKKRVQIMDWSNFTSLNINPEKNAIIVEYNLSISSNVTLLVYDETGNVKMQRLMSNQVVGDHLQKINTQFLQKGDYLIGVEGTKDRYYWRFTKQ